MSAEDLEKYETEMELTLYREYRDVVGIFKYVVETDRRFYLCNQVDVKARTEAGDVFFEVSMSDAWVWDMYRPGAVRQERQGAHVQGRQRRGAQPRGDRAAQGLRSSLTGPDQWSRAPPSGYEWRMGWGVARRRRAGRWPDERGAAAVEFALVVPFLLLILFGIISYGYMLSFRQTLSQAASEGARAAAGAPSTALASSAALSAVTDSLSQYGMTCNAGYLTCSAKVDGCDGDASHDCITVVVSYPYKDHALLPTFPGLGIVMPDELAYTSVARVN